MKIRQVAQTIHSTFYRENCPCPPHFAVNGYHGEVRQSRITCDAGEQSGDRTPRSRYWSAPGRTGTREERGQAPKTEPVPVLPWLLFKKSLRDWPRTGQLASRLASPISFNNQGLGFCWQDWPGWPRCHCFGVFKEAVLFVFLVFSSDARSIVRFLLSGDFRCH